MLQVVPYVLIKAGGIQRWKRFCLVNNEHKMISTLKNAFKYHLIWGVYATAKFATLLLQFSQKFDKNPAQVPK